MHDSKRLVLGIVVIFLLASSAFAVARARVEDVAIRVLADREAIVVTVSGELPSLDNIEITVDGRTMRFFVPDLEGSPPKLDVPKLTLIETVAISEAPDGFRMDVQLADDRLLSESGYRIGERDGRLIVIEFFKANTDARTAPPLELAKLEGESADSRYESAPGELRPMDIRNLAYAPAERLFGRLYEAGVVPLNGELRIYSPGHPWITASNATGGLPELLRETPPDFIVFAGTRDRLEKVANVLTVHTSEIEASPLLGDVLAGRDTSKMPPESKPIQHHERQYNDYPDFNLQARDFLELVEYQGSRSGRLSDANVTLDASSGLDFYAVMAVLSEVSGISIIVDPYTFQEPTGGRRAPLQTPPQTPGERSPGGFRDAGEFNPDIGGAGPSPFYGTFIDAPFDTVFETIIASNNLAYMLIQNPDDPYQKPVIFVTSRERMEHELRMAGANNITLMQAHYADVSQLGDILINMNILPSLDTGYYVYTGGQIGGGYGSGGNSAGGQGTGGRGSGGTGGAGGAGAFGASIPLPTAKGGLIIMRGSGADQAEFYNRLQARESKNRGGRLFFLRVAISPDAIENKLPADTLVSYLVML